MRAHLLPKTLSRLALAALVSTSASSYAAGQVTSRAETGRAAATKAYTPPRTPDGQPDLQGVWQNNDATPLERPKELEGRKFLTADEVAALKTKARELFNGETDAAFGDSVFLATLNAVKSSKNEFKSTDTTGNYNHFWIVDREFDNRTSVISDPPTGRIPELTEEGKTRRAAGAARRKLHPADGPEDLPLSHRCISFGVPRVRPGYNSYFQIVQTKDYVAISQEMIHDVRIIPLDGRQHVPSRARQWHGDARGHWEGETLVVETTNFSSQALFQDLPSDNLTTIERFTRIEPNTVKWEVTVKDPVTYTKPWTATVLLRHSPDHIYEMACHEGNEGLAGSLSGYRAQEREATRAQSASK